MKVKIDKNITSPGNIIININTNVPKIPKSPEIEELNQLKKDYQEKLNRVEKAKNYNPIKRSSRRKKDLEENILEVVEPKIDEKAKEEIIKIAQEHKEEELRKSKSNEIINENINNINNIKDIKEEEEENIMNEKDIIEYPKKGEGENPPEIKNDNNNKDNYEDILGNLPNFYEENNEININRENNIEPINININTINSNIIPPKTISKEEYLEFNSLFNSFYLVSFSKNFEFLDYYIHINADCAHEDCNGLPAIKPEIIYRHQLKKK